MNSGMRRCLLLAVVCIFAFSGGIAGSLMTSGLLYAESEKYDVLDDLLERMIEIEKMVRFSEDGAYKQGHFDHVQTKVLMSDFVSTNNISARSVQIFNDDAKTIASIYANDGSPVIKLCSEEQPCTEIVRNNEGEVVSVKEKDPGLILTMDQDEPVISLYDKDRDQRIFLGIFDLEPMIRFYYRNKTRLTLGTSRLFSRKTNKKTEVEGSVVCYDTKESVITTLPGLGY